MAVLRAVAAAAAATLGRHKRSPDLARPLRRSARLTGWPASSWTPK
jgi:hypothetical protein